jgi:hypothetical protein
MSHFLEFILLIPLSPFLLSSVSLSFVQPIIIPVPTPLGEGVSTSLATADDSTLALLLCSVFSKLRATGYYLYADVSAVVC